MREINLDEQMLLDCLLETSLVDLSMEHSLGFVLAPPSGIGLVDSLDSWLPKTLPTLVLVSVPRSGFDLDCWWEWELASLLAYWSD